MLKPALVGGVLLGILSALPLINYFNCFCCAWIIAGGILAARMYVQASPVAVTLGRGVAVGALTGVIGTVVFVLFSIPLWIMLNGTETGLVQQMKQMVEQLPNVPPETQQMLNELSRQKNVDAVIFVLGSIFWLAINCLVAMVGGAIGIALFEKRKTGAKPPDPAGSQPPPVNIPL
jgi:hypothetical protein